ncbi:hypothetical protein ZIOFF_050485 [Zingiber officinale]|uniref:Uncharacterized protein n=1 Tax=Zingiber officinale TaxID=94328 RepID=A0A8J5FKB1_ZINOF|nr:hypothetical protein ZIOFF_050485 [Zingiber officinale]
MNLARLIYENQDTRSATEIRKLGITRARDTSHYADCNLQLQNGLAVLDFPQISGCFRDDLAYEGAALVDISELFVVDIRLVYRIWRGSVAELDSGLQLLKKNAGNVDTRNAFGLTPLHIATWRNHVPMVKKLLAAGAHPDAKDGESEWSSLHRALHFGHLSIASVLLQAGASLTLENSKCRTPIDLISGPVSLAVGVYLVQLQLKCSVGEVGQTIRWEQAMHTSRSCHVKLMHFRDPITEIQTLIVSRNQWALLIQLSSNKLEHEAKQLNGHNLDDQQIVKIQMRFSLEGALADLGFPLETESKLLTSGLPDGKGNRKAEVSRKQTKTIKQKCTEFDTVSLASKPLEDQNSLKRFPDTRYHGKSKEDVAVYVDAISKNNMVVGKHENISLSHTSKIPRPTTSKKNNKKCCLSMFLNGAVDDTPKPAPMRRWC